MYLSGSYRNPDRKNTSPKPSANTPAMPRLLTERRYIVRAGMTIVTSDWKFGSGGGLEDGLGVLGKGMR